MKKGGIDISSVGGVVLALACILVGQALEGGHVGSVLQVTAALIVFGGTFGAVMVSFPMTDVVGGLKAAKRVFTESKPDLAGLIAEIVGYAQTARMKGLLALESQVSKASSPFLAQALRLAVDGTDPKLVREVLETSIQIEEDEAKRQAKIYEAAGGYAPTVGILGAVLGLIHVMENLTDPGKMGGGIAVAFVATVYGVGAANLLFLPVANKLKVKHERVVVARTMALEGLLAVQLGENPRLIEERLRSFLPEAERTEAESAAAARAA
jgi:chemotaxis protein MotA